MLASLRKAIEMDRNLFVKAKIDPMYDNVRLQVNTLLEDVLKQTKADAEKKLSNAEFAVKKMEMWFNNKYASNDDVQEYKVVNNNIYDAKNKLKTQSYFGYDDALKIMLETKGMLEKIQTSIRNKLDSLKADHHRYVNSANDIANEISNLNKKKNKNYVEKLSVAFGLALIMIFSYSSNQPGIFVLAMFTSLVLSIRYIWNYDYVTAIIISFIALIILAITDWMSKYFSLLSFLLLFIYLYFLAWPFVPDKTINSKLSDLESQHRHLKNLINSSEGQIATANESLISRLRPLII